MKYTFRSYLDFTLLIYYTSVMWLNIEIKDYQGIFFEIKF